MNRFIRFLVTSSALLALACLTGSIDRLRRLPRLVQEMARHASERRYAEMHAVPRQRATHMVGPLPPLPLDVREIEIERISQVPGLLDRLERVVQLTRLRFAAIARVSDARWTALALVDRVNFGLAPGQDMILEKTLCNEVRQLRQVVAFSHASNDPRFATHPLPVLYGFESHISTPIYLSDGQMFGTLCALDPNPVTLTSDMIKMVVDIASQIGIELSTDQQSAAGSDRAM